LAAGHERWVLEEYIRRSAPDQQSELINSLTPQIGFEDQDILTFQQNFGSIYGPEFFNAIVANLGATAVIEAWNRPPQSSAQILHPDEYTANNEPQSVLLPDLTTYLGEEWTPVITNVLGTFMLGQYLENFVAPDVVGTAVSGWQGDEYAIYQQGENGNPLLALQIKWASDQDAQEFASVYEEYVNGRFSETTTEQKSPENSACWSGTIDETIETICLYTDETQTLIIRAPEENLAVDTLEEIIEP